MPANPLAKVMRVNLMSKIFPMFFSVFFISCKLVDVNSQTSYIERPQSRSTLVNAKVDAIRQKVHEAGKNLTQLEVNPFIGSIIIAKGTDFNVIEAFGDRVSGEAEMTIDAVFPLASLTKIYSAVLLRKALELEGVDVREPVENYLTHIDLPENPDGSKMSIIQLAKHLGGFPQRVPEPRPFTEQKLKNWLTDNPSFIDDSGIYQYSTFSYSILGMVSERLLGKHFIEGLTEFIFKPLNLTNTGLGVSDFDRRDLIGAYSGGSRVEITDNLDGDFGSYSGGLFAKATDYANFLDLWVQTSKTDLSTTALSTLETGGYKFPDHPFYQEAAMGWHVVKGSGYYMNSAFGDGYHHTTWYDSKSKVIIAILTNTTFETTNSEPDQAANARLEQISAGLLSAIAALNDEEN